jgi:cytochrome P450
MHVDVSIFMHAWHACRQVAVALANEAVFMMLVGTDNSAYMLAQSMIYLHKHPEWLKAMNDEQARLKAEFGPEMGRQVCYLTRLEWTSVQLKLCQCYLPQPLK